VARIRASCASPRQARGRSKTELEGKHTMNRDYYFLSNLMSFFCIIFLLLCSMILDPLVLFAEENCNNKNVSSNDRFQSSENIIKAGSTFHILDCITSEKHENIVWEYIKGDYTKDLNELTEEQKDMLNDMKNELYVCLTYLNSDDTIDYIYVVRHLMWYGARSWPIGILVSDRDTFIDVRSSTSIGTHLNLKINSTITNGLRDISVGEQGNFIFNGTSYVYIKR